MKDVPDRFKTEEMCIEAVEVFPWQLKYVPDKFKTQDMCNEAVRRHHTYCNMFPIGLLQGRGYICGMMTVNMTMMKVIFLSGTIGIKNTRLKKPQ